jgi:hypothetical protein
MLAYMRAALVLAFALAALQLTAPPPALAAGVVGTGSAGSCD